MPTRRLNALAKSVGAIASPFEASGKNVEAPGIKRWEFKEKKQQLPLAINNL